jgi:hypothetical protein
MQAVVHADALGQDESEQLASAFLIWQPGEMLANMVDKT